MQPLPLDMRSTWREMLDINPEHLFVIRAGLTRRSFAPAEIEAVRDEIQRLERLLSEPN